MNVMNTKGRSGKMLLAKAALAAAIAVGGAAHPLASFAYAVEGPAAHTAVKLATAKQAWERAALLRIIPEGAEMTSGKGDVAGTRWELSYRHEDTAGNLKEGTAMLDASSGELLSLEERFNYGNGKVWEDVPFDETDQKVSYVDAVGIAHRYASGQPWQIDHQWMTTVVPQPPMTNRSVSPLLHTVPLNRSYDNGRFPNHFNVWIDRLTGEVVAHSVYWSKANVVYPDYFPAYETAAAEKYKQFEPLLDWTEANNRRAAYTFRELTGTLTTSEAETLHAAYSKALAKNRLLALYELEVVFIPDSSGNFSASYDFVLKQDVPLFYSGAAPAIDANTGEWVDFLGSALTEALPAPSEWLIDAAAPPGKPGYDAAVVWNNELLRLNNEPIIRNKTTTVPFRELLKLIGAKIGWHEPTRKVTASKDGTTVELTLGSSTAYINGEARQLAVPAFTRNGHTYIPARLVLEAFGATVDWDNDSRLVIVTTGTTTSSLSDADKKQLRFQALINKLERDADR